MANNYRKKPAYRSSKRGGGRSSNAWLWLLTGMFAGILGAALIYMMVMGNSTAKKLKLAQNPPTKQTTTTANPTKPAPTTANKNTAHQFEFYNILPGMEVKVPDPHTTRTKAASKTPSTVSVIPLKQPPKTSPKPNTKLNETVQATTKLTAAKYLIQVGMFRKLNQADTLKANLALQGFSPLIQKIDAQDGAWFRVTIGPFSSESKALLQKSILEKQKIQGTLVLQQ